MKAAFYTVGCKLNYSETSTISGTFKENGFEIVDFNLPADVYVINTCSVTENAESDCKQIIRKALKQNPNAFVAVVGCFAQLRPEKIAELKGVDLILGSSNKFDILKYAKDFVKKDFACVYIDDNNDKKSQPRSAFSAEGDERTRAFLKIQDGCDFKCSFCTIPRARGSSRSVPEEIIESNFRRLLQSGFKEIILTGVNVGDYGKHIGSNLLNLLKRLTSIEGDFRIRISSIEPNLLKDDLLYFMLENDKICNHFHIPLQSGSSKILRLMKRRYTPDYYYNLISKINKLAPDAGIGVDVIVGFPGETENDYLETKELILKIEIAYLHAFSYSERPDTLAEKMDGKVDISERKRRNNDLRALGRLKKSSFYKKFIGSSRTALIEKENRGGFLEGFWDNYVRVKIPYDIRAINAFAEVKALSYENEKLLCESLKILE